jgi:hypothetical protein
MDTETFMLLNGVLTFGAPLALAVRELVLLRRPGDGGSLKGGPQPDLPPPPPPAPAGNKPLPDCLIPKPLAPLPRNWPRVLEDA